MKKPIKIESIFEEKQVEIIFPPMPDIYIVSGFFKPTGYFGYWKILPGNHSTLKAAEDYCNSKIRSGWLCFKIYKLK